MGGSWFEIGDRHDISWFTEANRDTGDDHIEAVVVRRRAEPGAARPSVRPSTPAPGMWASVGNGPDQVRYSRERDVVAVRGREFPVPADGRALLVLIDERTATGEPSFETHAVDAPSVQRDSRDAGASRDERVARIHAHHREAREVWHRWLNEQPLIRSFLVD